MENKKPWFKWYGPKAFPSSKEGWVISIIGFLGIVFFLTRMDDAIAAQSGVGINLAGAIGSFVILMIIAIKKS